MYVLHQKPYLQSIIDKKPRDQIIRATSRKLTSQKYHTYQQCCAMYSFKLKIYQEPLKLQNSLNLSHYCLLSGLY